MLQVIFAIIAFGLLVIVHEFGHFITAKRSGVQVNEFWIGMGPCLLKKQWHGTLYCLRALPFGGACVMEGEDGESEHAHAFSKASLPRRMLIVVAGALMNFIVGYLIILCLLMPAKSFITPTIDSFMDGFSAKGDAMLLEGDTIVSINGYRVLLRGDVETGLARSTDGKQDIVVRRGGKKVALTDVPLTRSVVDADGNQKYGIQFSSIPATFANRLQFAGWESVYYARMIWASLGQLVSGQVGMDQLSGPVGVAEAMAETAKQSMASFFTLVAFISINLGVMNLLPLPALDGGRLLFLIIEAIRRKPVPPKYEGYVHAAGLLALLALMVYVTGQDIVRIFMR